MSKGINLKYKLNGMPPLVEVLLLGLQWLITAVPIFVMIAKVAAAVHYSAPVEQVIYIQKVLMASALPPQARRHVTHSYLQPLECC